MKSTRGSGRVTIVLAVVLAVTGLMTTGCSYFAKTAVRAVARGVPTASPFFDKALALGSDFAAGEALSRIGGEIQGDEPGLYGGTKDTSHCDKAKLVDFLQKPENRRKAEEWAEAQGLDDVDEIAGFVKELTPVLLRGDTLVKNHDYEKGRAKAFYALLEAGIAILVDELGRPAVQCSCGNPLGAYDRDIGDAEVEFEGAHKKWASYDSKKMAKVKPAPKRAPVEAYKLVNVRAPDTTLVRDAGSDGTDDEVLEETVIDGPSDAPSAEDTTSPLLLPDVRGMTVEDAQQLLQSQGLQTGTPENVSDAATPGTVIDQIPPPGEPAPPGSTVKLVVASATGPSTEPTLPPGPTETPLITGPPDESTATPGAAASGSFDGTTSD